jgi:hypothetical protein
VLANLDVSITAAEIDPHAIVKVVFVKRFGLIVSEHTQRFKHDHVLVAELVLITGRKIAIDTTLDALVLSAHPDRLGDLNVAILQHQDIAVKLKDALIRQRTRRPQQAEQQ